MPEPGPGLLTGAAFVLATAGAALFALTFFFAITVFFAAFEGEAVFFAAPARFEALAILVSEAIATSLAVFGEEACLLAIFEADAFAAARASFLAAALCRAQRRRCAAAIRSIASGLRVRGRDVSGTAAGPELFLDPGGRPRLFGTGAAILAGSDVARALPCPRKRSRTCVSRLISNVSASTISFVFIPVRIALHRIITTELSAVLQSSDVIDLSSPPEIESAAQLLTTPLTASRLARHFREWSTAAHECQPDRSRFDRLRAQLRPVRA